MSKTPQELWQRYRDHLCVCESIGLTLDISRMNFPDTFFAEMSERMAKAYKAMGELEGGAIANPDEKRMVGHYWLRDAALAPTPELGEEIRSCLANMLEFAGDVHAGTVTAANGSAFTDLLVIGIGGSALGPQFVADALSNPATDKLRVHFFDNTDPDGMARVLKQIGDDLGATLSVVVSKSGGTPETRNGMLLAKDAYGAAGLDFAKHAVAITGDGSNLDKVASEEDWLLRLPMWDWVGGRTSELAAVGLFPAALQGFDIEAMLEGAAATDAITRVADTPNNPAALLALMWYHATNGKGEKDMVVLPYKDRLLLFSRYLQQLVMESLGKELDLNGERVEQGIAVYGNKGSTDQHAYVQQLREGVNNFFATFIRVLDDGGSASEVEPGVTAGDYLEGFLQGTRAALYDNGRESMTLTVNTVDARTVGSLIALFERAVGFYATLVNINAYHQPGVEAGKKAAGDVLALQHKVAGYLDGGAPATAGVIAVAVGEADQAEAVYHLLMQLASNGRAKMTAGGHLCDAVFGG
jgi:glucose-6-phosphate isomerase